MKADLLPCPAESGHTRVIGSLCLIGVIGGRQPVLIQITCFITGALVMNILQFTEWLFRSVKDFR